MTYRDTEPPTARQQLAHVLRFARTAGIWHRNGNTWRDGGDFTVSWDPYNATITVRRTSHHTGERLTSEAEVDSTREALDMLAACHALPLIYAPAYLDGVHAGTVTAERIAHEHYNRHRAARIRDLLDEIFSLGVFVDNEHEWKPATSCWPEPGEDCVDWCAACKALADLDDETLTRIRAERAVSS